MHHLIKMAANASDTDSDKILVFYLFTRRRRRKRRYRRISVHPLTEAWYLWRILPPSKGASFPPRQVSLLYFRMTEQKDWLVDKKKFVRLSHKNSLWGQSLRLSAEQQFPAAFVVAFGINGFIQIAYTKSNANAALAFVIAFVITSFIRLYFNHKLLPQSKHTFCSVHCIKYNMQYLSYPSIFSSHFVFSFYFPYLGFTLTFLRLPN